MEITLVSSLRKNIVAVMIGWECAKAEMQSGKIRVGFGTVLLSIEVEGRRFRPRAHDLQREAQTKCPCQK